MASFITLLDSCSTGLFCLDKSPVLAGGVEVRRLWKEFITRPSPPKKIENIFAYKSSAS